MSDPRPEHLAEAEHKTGIDPIYAGQRYAAALPILRAVAREHGYAVAVHGSMRRDLDVVAVPWVEDASEPLALAKALEAAVGGFILWRRDEDGGSGKPHGRRCWSIHLGGGPYIDLSVMPRGPR